MMTTIVMMVRTRTTAFMYRFRVNKQGEASEHVTQPGAH